MLTTPTLPFAATRMPLGDIMVFYLGPSPRLTPAQAREFSDQLRNLADNEPERLGAASTPS
ncbi:hypothetical protein [Sinosporangium album]|uniref:hypothetical protein n=1 Tax=Sinosporangium album TaxID=504805 RepID=UPI000B86A04C|nr:hypothetical protein [Sinosporangium album]